MGALLYGGEHRIEFDDRLLAHLQIVIGSKLRRHEGFFLSWSEQTGTGNGHVTIWIDPAQPLMFRYEGDTQLMINREWLGTLTVAANSARGLVVTEESPRLSSES